MVTLTRFMRRIPKTGGGLLEGTTVPIKGIDEYMKANGFEWPRPANAPKQISYYPAGTRYRVSNFDVHFTVLSWRWLPLSAALKETSATPRRRCGNSVSWMFTPNGKGVGFKSRRIQ